jgi:hypothetical protein
MQKDKLNAAHILENSVCCTYLMRRVFLRVAGLRGVEFRKNFEKYYAHAVFCISLFQYFAFVAAYLENAVSHSYEDGNGSRLFSAVLEMCENSSLRPGQKIIREAFVYVSFKPVSIETSINC